MADKSKIVIFAIAIIALVFVGMYIQKSYPIFSILPAGQYNSNSDCTFITNTNYGTNGEQIGDYGSSGSWVSIDWNGDGTKEGYGQYGSTGSSADKCTGLSVIATTSAGLRVVKYSETATYKEIGVCSSDGMSIKRYRDTASSASSAILTCSGTGCVPNCIGKCGGVSDGCSGTCTATCGGTGNCLLVDANGNGKVDRDELGQVISAWVVG